MDDADKAAFQTVASFAGYGQLRFLHDGLVMADAGPWNPVTSDGDALGLAVLLSIRFWAMKHCAIASHDDLSVRVVVPFDAPEIRGDRCYAARCAIFVCALQLAQKRRGDSHEQG